MDNNAIDEKKLIKNQVLSCIWIFLIPVLTLLFFYHAESSYNSLWQDAQLSAVKTDRSIDQVDKDNIIARINDISPSEMLRKDPTAFKQLVGEETQFSYKMFRWMIILCWIAIITSIVVFALSALIVKLSSRSQQALYRSLASGFTILRIFATGQVLLQGIMVTALSYWVTAIWFNFYAPKIIAAVGIVSLIGAWSIIRAIFIRFDDKFTLVGNNIDREKSPWIWQSVDEVCRELGTEAPQQIIAGIDDNFFVTESDVYIEDQKFSGRTLFISLSLLKHLEASEAEAVMAHEMAHFSGNDTFFSQKISPTLSRYGAYLGALYESPLSRPVFHYMCAFRDLFEMSIGRQSREREFRADKIAADRASSMDLCKALVKIVSYSRYRMEIEEKLFNHDKSFENVDIKQQIEGGYAGYVSSIKQIDLEDSQSAHPFDSHPPLTDRFKALGVSVPEAMNSVIQLDNGKWYTEIKDADVMEAEEWSKYEKLFAEVHEEYLIYQYLPSNEKEAAFLAKHFPEILIKGKKSEMDLTLDYEKLKVKSWERAILFSEIADLAYHTSSLGDTLAIKLKAGGKKMKVKVTKYQQNKTEVTEFLNKYISRYFAAEEYLQIKTYQEKNEE